MNGLDRDRTGGAAGASGASGAAWAPRVRCAARRAANPASGWRSRSPRRCPRRQDQSDSRVVRSW